MLYYTLPMFIVNSAFYSKVYTGLRDHTPDTSKLCVCILHALKNVKFLMRPKQRLKTVQKCQGFS